MKLRSRILDRLDGGSYDVLVVGAGINGAATAAALSARGVRVALIDSRDFAGFTSQQSSNLVWGGIKYMENYEFGLVWDLCRSRNELMRSFPSTVREIRFLTTVSTGFRHNPLMLWLGAWLYWFMGRGFTRVPKYLPVSRIRGKEPSINVTDSPGGIEYSDAFLHDNDARFVFNFVRNALDTGCDAANYVEATGAAREANGNWITHARDTITGKKFEIRSRVLVNAAGAFVDQFNETSEKSGGYLHVLSRGVHLIVPRINQENRVLAFFARDGRLFFAIPMANRTCIGTTDTRVTDPETEVTDEDRDYILSNINARLNLDKKLTREDIISERCGVRPLVVENRDGENSGTDFLQLSRKHILESLPNQQYISIYGGKLTDCVNIGDEVCSLVREQGVTVSELPDRWYGEPTGTRKAEFHRRAGNLGLDRDVAADTGEDLSVRLWRRYGTRAEKVLDIIESDPGLAAPVVGGMGLRYAEIVYMAEHEMVVTLEDLLRRRSKIALLVSRDSLNSNPGLEQVCETLFGKQAQAKLAEFQLANQ